MITDPLNDGLGEIRAKIDAAHAAFPGHVVLTKPLLQPYQMKAFYPLTPEGVAEGMAIAAHIAKCMENQDAILGLPTLKKKGKWLVPDQAAVGMPGFLAQQETCLMFENAPWPEWWLDAVTSGQMADVCEIARASGRKIEELEAVVLLAAG